MRNEVASFLLALQFLTRIPVPSDKFYSPERMAESVRYYPLIGLVIGGVSGGVFWIAHLLLPIVIAVFFATGAGLLLTGAFHEDGLADTFDGIGGGQSRERALEIMRDSRLGTYGTAALIIALGLKISALSGLTPALIVAALIAGHGLSRLSSLLVIATSRYVRDEGAGKPVARNLSLASVMVALILGAMVVIAWCLTVSPMALLYAGTGLLGGHVLIRLFFEPKLKGYTGDTLGAVQQASEIGFYLGLIAWL